MALSRRNFIRFASQLGVAASTSMLWSNRASASALADLGSTDYKALVVITMIGGNDCNNTVVPMDSSNYNAYNSLRPSIALAGNTLLPIATPSGSSAYGLHPSLKNIASLYNQKKAVVVANVGSLPRPATKADVLKNQAQFPGLTLNHVIGQQQWETAQASSTSTTGWGGRLADYITSESGGLPPVLSAGGSALFTVGKSVQAVTLQSGSAFAAIPADVTAAMASIAATNKSSANEYVQQHATLRAEALMSQTLLDKASTAATLKTAFPTSRFGSGMKKIAQLLAGRSVTGASRQVFYIEQGSYDTHQVQLTLHSAQLADLDAGLGAFFAALDELGLTDQVMVCTHSDFGRTLQANASSGTDHAWGGHHFILGGGINGGRIVGTMPEMAFGGPTDVYNMGMWIPTQSVTQMTASLGQWMGLNTAQLNDVFVDLKNFPGGALQLW